MGQQQWWCSAVESESKKPEINIIEFVDKATSNDHGHCKKRENRHRSATKKRSCKQPSFLRCALPVGAALASMLGCRDTFYTNTRQPGRTGLDAQWRQPLQPHQCRKLQKYLHVLQSFAELISTFNHHQPMMCLKRKTINYFGIKGQQRRQYWKLTVHSCCADTDAGGERGDVCLHCVALTTTKRKM